MRKVIEVPEVEIKRVTSEGLDDDEVDLLGYTTKSKIVEPTFDKTNYDSPERKVFHLKSMMLGNSP